MANEYKSIKDGSHSLLEDKERAVAGIVLRFKYGLNSSRFALFSAY